jgi:hypothetical protein
MRRTARAFTVYDQISTVLFDLSIGPLRQADRGENGVVLSHPARAAVTTELCMKSIAASPISPDTPLLTGFGPPRDHSVRFPDSAAFVAGSFQAFVGDFCPELLQLRRCRLVRVPFGVIR